VFSTQIDALDTISKCENFPLTATDTHQHYMKTSRVNPDVTADPHRVFGIRYSSAYSSCISSRCSNACGTSRFEAEVYHWSDWRFLGSESTVRI
jgi:hypothetical protein